MTAPSEILLMRAGWNQAPRPASGNAENFLIDHQAARRVIAAFKRKGRDLVIDYDHQSEMPERRPADGIARAAGWITSLDWRPGRGLYATVRWTETARAALESGEIRYSSPSIDIDAKSGRVIELRSFALTNRLATLGVEPLAASEATDRPGRRKVRGRAVELVAAPTGGRFTERTAPTTAKPARRRHEFLVTVDRIQAARQISRKEATRAAVREFPGLHTAFLRATAPRVAARRNDS